MKTLVRPEVLDARQNQWFGTARLDSPVSHRVLTIASLLFGVATAMTIWLGAYTRRESVSGILVPAAGLINVDAPSNGVVAGVKVAEGDTVAESNPLLILATRRSTELTGDATQYMVDRYKGQRTRLDQSLADQKQIEKAKASELNARIGMLKDQISLLSEQLKIQSMQAASARALLAKISPLQANGYISAVQIQQQTASVYEAEASEKQVLKQRLDAQQQLGTAMSELGELPLTTQTDIHELEIRRAEVERNLAQSEVEQASLLRSPTNGTVTSLLVRPGQNVVAGQSMLAIAPAESKLVAQLLVPSRAVGFIEIGDTVALRYQSFPYQQYGRHLGHVTGVSGSALSPSQVASLVGVETKEGLYRVSVTLDTQDVTDGRRRWRLKPGMAVDAEILLDRHRLYEWIFPRRDRAIDHMHAEKEGSS